MKNHSLAPVPPRDNVRTRSPRSRPSPTSSNGNSRANGLSTSTWFAGGNRPILGRCLRFAVAGLIVVQLSSQLGNAQSLHDSPTLPLTDSQRAKCLKVLADGFAGDEFWPSIHAAEGLIDGGEADRVVPVLRKKLATETDDQQRCGLARELVRAGDRTATRHLLAILHKSQTNGLTHACESLYKVNEIGDGRQLRRFLADGKEPRRQLMAAAALARWGNPDAYRLLRHQLATTGDKEVLRISAWVLARVGDVSDIPTLQSALARCGNDDLLRAYINHALALLGDSGGQSALRKNLEHRDGAVRTYAATFAGEVRDPQTRPLLLKMLDDPIPDARIRAAHSLLQLASPAPLDRHADIAREVYVASEKSPRWSEGSIVHRRDGSLLYATTQFLDSASDFARAQIVARVSSDGGRTWQRPTTLQSNIGKKNVMSVTLRYLGDPFDPETELGLFYLVKNSVRDLHVLVRISTDDGATFGEPRQVTRGAGYFVVNNDRVVRLRSGRLIVPTSWTTDVAKSNHFKIRVWYSDDQARTWQESSTSLDYARRGAMEPGVVQLADDSLLMIVRTQLGHIAVSRSTDDGVTWSRLEKSAIVSPESPATLRVIPSTGDLLLVWNNRYKPGAGHGGKRTPLVAAVSNDDGQTWSSPRVLEDDPQATFAYTSLMFAGGRVVMSYYVRDETTGRISSRFRSLPIEWFYRADDGELGAD